MRKCLIVQFEPRHEEVIPSVIAACNAAGYRPTVLLNRRIRRIRGDIFDQVQGGDADIRYQPLSPDKDDEATDWDSLLSDDVDFVLLNTMNRPKVARWAKRCGKPVIALVHNVDQFMSGPEYTALLERANFAVMTLGLHVMTALNASTDGKFADKIGLLAPYVLTDTPPDYSVSSPRKVVVPGNLTLRSRNYLGLIAALSSHPRRWENLVFEFPSSGADRDRVAAAIAENKLDHKMTILPAGQLNEVPHKDVFDSFRSATFLHSLIAEGFAQYQRIKITSTTSMSVGFGVPVIMDRYSESCYRFPMLVSDNTVEETLDRLSEVTERELLDINAGLATFRQQMNERSGRDLRRLISLVV
tara:strand:+ start:172257 stop:173330 length:1074 start_codon:yes stop_codon:yes gene_type:complete